MIAKVSVQIVKNVLKSIVLYQRSGCFVTFDKNGWVTSRY